MRGLPANIPLGELQKQKMEAIGPTHDTGNPTIASEFFDTRQARIAWTLCPHFRLDYVAVFCVHQQHSGRASNQKKFAPERGGISVCQERQI